MSTLNTRFLVDQLRQKLAQDAALATRAGCDARDAAQHSATAQEKREDGRTMIEFGNMARAQALRVEQIRQALAALDAFSAKGLPRIARGSRIAVGAIVDAFTEDETGELGRTFVMLPVGAGEELQGPGGDGIITVLTPSSPVGRAMLGKGPGDVAEVVIKGEPIDWEVLEVGS